VTEGRPSRTRLPGPARALIFVFVAVLALDHYHNHLALTPGIDFYQYWAVPTARRISAERLGSPYADTDRYAEVLQAVANRSSDGRLKAVAEYREAPDFASDPLLYVIGGWLPSDYTTALKLYQLLQFAALALALFLLSRRASLPGLETATLGLLMILYFMPVLSDLRVLNTNVLQLCALAMAASLLQPGRAAWNLPRASLGLSLTVLVVFLKPLWALLPPLTALYVLRHHGRSSAVKAGALAAAFAAALFAWPAASFGPGVWSDWYDAVFRADPGRLLYSVEEGNRSAPTLLADTTGLSLGSAVIVVALLLAVSALAAVATSSRHSTVGSRWAAVAALPARLLARPETTLGLGIVVMLALSPLVWWHYQTLGLILAFSLLSPSASNLQATLAVLWFLLSSGRLGPIYVWFGDADQATLWGAAFAWLPLWIALALPFAPAPTDSSGE
jgi:hypothetical protein